MRKVAIDGTRYRSRRSVPKRPRPWPGGLNRQRIIGNVARLAAELVGPHGAVVGVERDPAAAEGGPDAPAWAWANVISATVPLMELHGIATRADLDPSTLADRLLAETLAADGCVLGPPMFGAWASVPAP